MSELPKFALSIRQPWAWLIIHGYKDIENRTWPTNFRGPVLIHAGKGMTKDEFHDALYFAQSIDPKIDFFFDHMERGGIVGQADIMRCVTDSESEWFGGPFGFVIKNAKPLPFLPCKGALGFFRPNIEVPL